MDNVCKIMNFKLFFHFYFLNIDISLYYYPPIMQFYTGVYNILLKGTMSQILNYGLSFFYVKKRVTFGHFLKLIFSRMHNIKTKPLIKH